MVPVTLATFEVVGFPISNIKKMLIKYLLTVTFLDLLVEFTNGLRLPKWKVMYFLGSQAGSPRVWRVCSIFRTLSRCALRVPRVLGPAHCEVANAAGGWASEVRAVEMNSGRQETSVRERSDSRKAADGRLQSNGEGEVAANTAPPPRSPQPAGGALRAARQTPAFAARTLRVSPPRGTLHGPHGATPRTPRLHVGSCLGAGASDWLAARVLVFELRR